jgi:hypothetical protein
MTGQIGRKKWEELKTVVSMGNVRLTFVNPKCYKLHWCFFTCVV